MFPSTHETLACHGVPGGWQRAHGPRARREPSPDLGGFSMSFFVPFPRLDLYKQLLIEDNPLGSGGNVHFTILREGAAGAFCSVRMSLRWLRQSPRRNASLVKKWH